MIIKERKITEAQISEIVDIIQNEEAIISLDKNDVRSVLVGKEGILYEACQEEGVSNADFMRIFFGELKKKEEVRTCSSVLISIGMAPDSPLMMENMEIIHDFFESLEDENMEAKWGVKNNLEGQPMTILTVCAKAIV